MKEKKLKPKKKRKLVKFLIYSFSILMILVLFFHIFLNTKWGQNITLKVIQKRLSVSVKWDELSFNGMTGRFEGKKLDITHLKNKSHITLEKFKFVLDPVRLVIFGEIKLTDINAEDLEIDMSEFVPQKSGEPASKGKIHKAIATILRLFRAENGAITNILVKLPDEAKVTIQKLEVKNKSGLSIFKHPLGWELTKVAFTSERFDFFSDNFTAGGSLEVKKDAEKNEKIFFNGNLVFKNLLLGLNKTPIPWNTTPGFDESLKPVLQKFYGNTTPNNRVFAHFTTARLQFKHDQNVYEIEKGRFKAFGGRFNLKANWNEKTGQGEMAFNTTKDLTMALLPFGQSRIRQSFKNIQANLFLSGVFYDINKAKLKGDLAITAKELVTKPGLHPLAIKTPITFENGLLQAPQINITLVDGLIQGKGSIHVPEKKVSASFSIKNMDAQTVVHLFSKIDILGKASGKGSIEGNLLNPTFDIDLEATDAGYESLVFGNFKGNLGIKDKTLDLTGNSNLGGVGTGKINLKIKELFRSALQEVDLKTDFTGLPANLLLKSEKITGSVRGFFNMQKKQDTTNGTGEVEATNMTWLDIPVEKLKGQIKLSGNEVSIKPIQINFGPHAQSTTSPEPLLITFNDLGYTLKGKPMNGVLLEGTFKNGDTFLPLKITFSNLSLKFLTPLIPIDTDEISASGVSNIIYNFENPLNTSVNTQFSAFHYKGSEKTVTLQNKGELDYLNQVYTFKNTSIKLGQGVLNLDGPLSLVDNSQLKIKGSLDLSQLNELHPLLSEGEGVSAVDLVWKGSFYKPVFEGKLNLKNNTLIFRSFGGEISEANGEIQFTGQKTQFNNVKLNYDDAPVVLNGWIESDAMRRIVSSDLKIKMDEVSIVEPDTWRLLASGDIRLSGIGTGQKISGNLTIVEGLYYKSYSVTDFIIKPSSAKNSKEGRFSFLPENVGLDIKTTGDIDLKNNLGLLTMNLNLSILGTILSPRLKGQINITEGSISAFGLSFEEASGFVNFTGEGTINPLIDFSATQNVQEYEMRAKIQGYLDNLAMTLESTPALNQGDIISLLAYGKTPDQLPGKSQNLFSQAAIASQLLGVLQAPLSKAAQLDIFRVELTENQSNTGTQLSRFAIGKRFTNRFSLLFTNELTDEGNVSGVEAEFKILDNLLFKGFTSSSGQYSIDLAFRLQWY